MPVQSRSPKDRREEVLRFAELPILSAHGSAAMQGYAAALERDPNAARRSLDILPPGARIVQAFRTPYVFDSEAQIRDERQRVLRALAAASETEFDPLDALAAASRSPISMAWLYHGLPDAELRRPYGRFLHDRLLMPTAPDLLEPMPDRKPGKVRVGYLSPQLRNSNASRWAIALARSHPETEMEVFAFDVGPWQDERTEEWKQLADRFFRLEGSPLEMGRAIRNQDLDVLIFTDIGIDGLTDVLGSMRLARRQCALWGGPCSSSLLHVDYFLAGEFMVEDESEFSERVVRLPGAGVFYERRLIEPSAGRPARAPVEPMAFCMQTIAKCHPRWDSLFAKVAQQLGVPILFTQTDAPGLVEKTIRRFKQNGVRSLFMPRVPETHFSGVLELTSLSVDTPSYNGGITAILALAAGVPILTLEGVKMRDRFGSAFLRQVGLERHICRTETEYLAAVRNWSTLREETRSPNVAGRLFEDVRVLESVERFLLDF